VLFVSVKTIESNLSRIYAKLGVRSRTALASRLHAEDPVSIDGGSPGRP
jgi:DNA-binding NarL/FixJ family response regulator